MATAKITLGALLGTVGTAATVATDGLQNVGKGMSMLSNYMDKALTEQQKQHAIDLAQLDNRLAIDAANEEARLDLEVDKFRSQSGKHAEYFDRAYAKYASLLANAGKSGDDRTLRSVA